MGQVKWAFSPFLISCTRIMPSENDTLSWLNSSIPATGVTRVHGPLLRAQSPMKHQRPQSFLNLYRAGLAQILQGRPEPLTVSCFGLLDLVEGVKTHAGFDAFHESRLQHIDGQSVQFDSNIAILRDKGHASRIRGLREIRRQVIALHVV